MALRRALSWLPALLAAAPLLTACAAPTQASATCIPTIEGGWVRKPPADLPMLAAYARIANRCDAAVVVVSAHSPAFAEVSLHATKVEGGVSRMREVAELHIEAGETAVLEPGGMHLMLMQPKRPLRTGDSVEIRFSLADGREVAGRFAVKGPKAMP